MRSGLSSTAPKAWDKEYPSSPPSWMEPGVSGAKMCIRDRVTYGQSISFQTTGGAGTGKVTFWVEPRGGRGAATIDSNGVLQGTQTGSVLVYAKKDGEDVYKRQPGPCATSMGCC